MNRESGGGKSVCVCGWGVGGMDGKTDIDRKGSGKSVSIVL